MQSDRPVPQKTRGAGVTDGEAVGAWAAPSSRFLDPDDTGKVSTKKGNHAPPATVAEQPMAQ